MERIALVRELNRMLLDEMPQYRQRLRQDINDYTWQRNLLRSLMNIRPPMLLQLEFLALQDELLSAEREEKGIVDGRSLPGCGEDRISLWRGDITRLNVDAIVNAANGSLLGCFQPCHNCIDNAIHSAAGLQLREECFELMKLQDDEEAPGRARITRAYNLPARHVLHTVGPIIMHELTSEDRVLLSACYSSCLETASENELRTIAFCCISTGEYRFPKQEAAEIAIQTVKRYLEAESWIERVIFDVFTDEDYSIYGRLLKR